MFETQTSAVFLTRWTEKQHQWHSPSPEADQEEVSQEPKPYSSKQVFNQP